LKKEFPEGLMTFSKSKVWDPRKLDALFRTGISNITQLKEAIKQKQIKWIERVH